MTAPLPGNDSGGTLPFEGSEEIAVIMEGLIAKWGIQRFVETGTQRGASALWASRHVANVLTIEADKGYFDEAAKNLVGTGVIQRFGDSADALSRIEFIHGERVLFFLDAHGCKVGGTALARELQTIRRAFYKHSIRPVIAIHDVQVPDHPELGYDKYEDCELSVQFVLDALSATGWGCWPIRYNSVPNGAARGFCYITPE